MMLSGDIMGCNRLDKVKSNNTSTRGNPRVKAHGSHCGPRWESCLLERGGTHRQYCRPATSVRSNMLPPSSRYRGLWRCSPIVVSALKMEAAYFSEMLVFSTKARGNSKLKLKTPWSESASELYRPSDRRLSAKWLPTFADKGCHVVSVADPYGRILGFLDRSRYFSIDCTHEAEWTPFQTHYVFFVVPGIEPGPPDL
jgi:hypothetical protein